MSLNVYLYGEKEQINPKIIGTGLLVNEDGKSRELMLSEIIEKFPNLIIEEYDDFDDDYLFSKNITHNLKEMAMAADLYKPIWRPYQLVNGYDIEEDDHKKQWEFEESVTIKAKDITELVKKGLKKLKAKPDYYKKYNPENGWGSYEGLVKFVEEYLEALEEYPDAIVITSR